MANKVLSIKMDEEEIKRLKKYHTLLIKLGFVTKENLTFNAFLKHMLTNNITLDFKQMCAAYSEYGGMPAFLNPEYVGEEKLVKLPNTYRFDEEEYQAYKKCFVDALYKVMEQSEQDAEEMQKILGIGIGWSGGVERTLEVFGEEDTPSKFWLKKLDEERMIEKQESEKSERDYMIRIIEESELEETMKKRIIDMIDGWLDDEQKRKKLLRQVGK